MLTGDSGATPKDTIERYRHTMIAEPVCVAMRGRYNDDGATSQHIEVRGAKTNALTTVGKDNLIMEKIIMINGEDNNT